ncbi:hypothetical protein D3C75_875600 [compost metagenome]
MDPLSAIRIRYGQLFIRCIRQDGPAIPDHPALTAGNIPTDFSAKPFDCRTQRNLILSLTNPVFSGEQPDFLHSDLQCQRFAGCKQLPVRDDICRNPSLGWLGMTCSGSGGGYPELDWRHLSIQHAKGISSCFVALDNIRQGLGALLMAPSVMQQQDHPGSGQIGYRFLQNIRSRHPLALGITAVHRPVHYGIARLLQQLEIRFVKMPVCAAWRTHKLRAHPGDVPDNLLGLLDLRPKLCKSAI